MQLVEKERRLACTAVAQLPGVSMKTFCKALDFWSRGAQRQQHGLDCTHTTMRCAHLQEKQQLHPSVDVRPWGRWEGRLEHPRRQLP